MFDERRSFCSKYLVSAAFLLFLEPLTQVGKRRMTELRMEMKLPLPNYCKSKWNWINQRRNKWMTMSFRTTTTKKDWRIEPHGKIVSHSTNQIDLFISILVASQWYCFNTQYPSSSNGNFFPTILSFLVDFRYFFPDLPSQYSIDHSLSPRFSAFPLLVTWVHRL